MASGEWDWKRAIPVWEWHELSLDGWPGWDRAEGGKEPCRVSLVLTLGLTASSRQIALAVDDWAQGRFYYRDYTENATPFVADGEQYKASFWFEKRADGERFRQEYSQYLPAARGSQPLPSTASRAKQPQ